VVQRRTLVTFHAHPDDEAIATGGSMAKAAAAGHRVVLVLATRGELGEVVEGVLNDGEELAARRVIEADAAAKILGVERVAFLGYRDSGMADDPRRHDAGSFASADVEEAAQRLATILVEEQADVLTVYDSNGNYGHPDHIQVHRVGHRAGEIAKTPAVFEATMNHDYIVGLMTELADQMPEGVDSPDPEDMDLGVPESELTTKVDVTAFVDAKRAAMAAHASQIDDNSFFLQMPPEVFRRAFGYEWFIHKGVEPGIKESDLFESLPG
jgi:LmbE family N-acetylglucosaminyl deacetylase